MIRPIVRLRQTLFAARKVRLPIAPGARVLEVGGGDSPSPRADVLVDFALEPRERQRGRIRRDDRPWFWPGSRRCRFATSPSIT